MSTYIHLLKITFACSDKILLKVENQWHIAGKRLEMEWSAHRFAPREELSD